MTPEEEQGHFFQLLRKLPGEAARVSGQSGLMRRKKKRWRERHCPKVCQYATLLLEHSQLFNSLVFALHNCEHFEPYCPILH